MKGVQTAVAARGDNIDTLTQRDAFSTATSQALWSPGPKGWSGRFFFGEDGHVHDADGKPWRHSWGPLADGNLVVVSHTGVVDMFSVDLKTGKARAACVGNLAQPTVSWNATKAARPDAPPANESVAALVTAAREAKSAYRERLTALATEREAAADTAGKDAAQLLVVELNERPDTLADRAQFADAVSRVAWTPGTKGWSKPFYFGADGHIHLVEGERWPHFWTTPTAGTIVVLGPTGIVDVFAIDLEKGTAKATCVGTTAKPSVRWDATKQSHPTPVQIASREKDPTKPPASTSPMNKPAPKTTATAKPADKPSTPAPPTPSAPAPTPPTPTTTADASLVEFRPLVMPEAVTSFTLTEDGRFLVASHMAANQVTIWNAAKGEAVKTLSTERPRNVLARGQELFVVNQGKGTISQFAIDKDWQAVNQFDVGKPDIVHISAARGAAFNGLLLATCHPAGPEGSYRGATVSVVDTVKDTVTPAGSHAVASISCDGKLFVTQGSFNLSPSGGISVFALADVLGKGGAKPISQGGSQQTPWVFQMHPGQYWIGNHIVFAGAPLQVLKDKDLGNILVPDQAERVIYSLTNDRITARRLDTALSELGSRKVVFPAETTQQFEGVYHTVHRHRGYLLDHPIGITQGESLRLFVLDFRRNVLLTATTPAWDARSAEIAATQPGETTDAPGPPPLPVTGAPTTGELNVPLRCFEGDKLNVQLKADSGAQFALLTGPEGMTVTADGKLAWTPSEAQMGEHRLKIRVIAKAETIFARPTIEVVHRDLGPSATTGSVTSRADRIDLDVDQVTFKPGELYRSLLLLQGERLRVLGPDGLTTTADITLPERYQQIAERGDTYIALSRQPAQLDVISNQSRKVTKSLPIEKSGVRVLEVMDFVPHPTERRTFVTIKHDIDLPRYRILIVDEQTGAVEAPEGLIGTWVTIDPAGRYLYAGYKDIYSKGSQFHINPDWRVIEMPQYGNVDWILSYELRGRQLKLRHVENKAGGNGNGIRMSADGQRITYLSHVGTPLHSRNLVGWNPTKLTDSPVTYPTKDRAVTTQLAFHPTLKLVAVPGGTSAVLFDRETGKVVENRLQLAASGLGNVKVDDLLFSPDGTALIFQCNAGAEGRYLQKVGLRLSAEEKTVASRGVVATAIASMSQPSRKPVALSELTALKDGPPPASITPKEISRRYMAAVVQVKSDVGSGTGFVVGPRGYVLTCAHVVSNDEDLRIGFRANDGSDKLTTLPATVVLMDDELDLALLKVDLKQDLTAVSLAANEPVESGEEAIVIGNPGVGSTILTQTLTTGVVSNPSRKIDGRQYLQTSAAINPGNSGGPMFNERGQVIGLVVLKARIEGAAFAVPAPVLRDFLRKAVDGPSK